MAQLANVSHSKVKICPQQNQFISANKQGEKRTLYVLVFTLLTMTAEIIAGTLYGSMALLADGWHMSTHAAAFMITLFTYHYARKHAANAKFSFGTGKVSALGGYTSAIALTLVAMVMVVESVQRLFAPQLIHFNEAILVASLGLLVNIVSAFMLKEEDHPHRHQHHHDHNLKAAYMHVLADALTSALAIIALIAGKYWGWNWLDAMMGIVGAIIIARWSYGLIKQTSPILLDGSIDQAYLQDIVRTIEQDGQQNQVHDLHVWKISSDHYAAMMTIKSQDNKSAYYYKKLLHEFDKIDHLTIEVITVLPDDAPHSH